MEYLRIVGFTDYKAYLLKRIENLPKRGHGQLQRLAKFLSIHPTLVSQVLRGDKNFTSEQTCLAAEFFGLGESEADYLLALVERERAGNGTLRKYWSRRLSELKDALKVARTPGHAMTEQERFEFYSSWEYSGVRLSTSIDDLQTVDAVAERLGLTAKRVNEIIAFLLATGLCVEKQGRIQMGPARTFISRESPMAFRHHLNWRLKALEAYDHFRASEFAFTFPMTISQGDREKIRELLVETVERTSKLVSSSGAEELCCLNLDFFEVRKAQTV
jgi:uncharacterized protein (TIGR02147 family)